MQIFICECGCGGELPSRYNHFLTGHRTKGKRLPASHIEAIRQGLEDFHNSVEGEIYRQEASDRMLEISPKLHSIRWNGPNSEKNRQDASCRLASHWNGPDGATNRDIQSSKMTRLFLGPEGEERRKRYSRQMSTQNLAYYNGPDGDQHRQELRDRFKDQVYARRCLAGNRKTKTEAFLEDYLQEKFPNQWKYTGCGEETSKLGSRIPDFTNIAGRKKVIELFGTYHHGIEEEQLRLDYYQSLGYDCLVIWANDVEDIIFNLHLVSRFCKGGPNG